MANKEVYRDDTVGSRPKKFFSKYKKPLIDMPDLFEGQIESFNWLLKEGVQEVFKEFSPIKDYSEKKFDLEFVGFEFESPKYTEAQAKENRLTYEAAFKVRAKLTNKNGDVLPGMVYQRFLHHFEMLFMRIFKCCNNTKKMRYYLLISDKYKGVKVTTTKTQLDLKALYNISNERSSKNLSFACFKNVYLVGFK